MCWLTGSSILPHQGRWGEAESCVFHGGFGQSWDAAEWDWSLWLLFSPPKRHFCPKMQTKESPEWLQADRRRVCERERISVHSHMSCTLQKPSPCFPIYVIILIIINNHWYQPVAVGNSSKKWYWGKVWSGAWGLPERPSSCCPTFFRWKTLCFRWPFVFFFSSILYGPALPKRSETKVKVRSPSGTVGWVAEQDLMCS